MTGVQTCALPISVYDALVKEGVSKDQLELVGFGGTDNMFGKNFLNRVVILE